MCNMRLPEPVRAVELKQVRLCSCGAVMRHVGVCIKQPQPEPGDYTMCPYCFTIYVLTEEYALEQPREVDIPLKYIRARDKLIGEARHKAGVASA